MWFLYRKGKRRFSLGFIAFLQALGLILYCSLVAILMWNGQRWFGRITNFTGPLLFLTLFTTSALVSGLLVLGYPFLIFWEGKNTKEAVKLVGYTAVWLIFFVLAILFLLLR